MMVLKISVLKNVKQDDIIAEYGLEFNPICDRHQVGQEFIVKDDLQKPEGFCSWAWADLHREIVHIAFGGDYPWMKKRGMVISCCTDGTRPVIFKIERV